MRALLEFHQYLPVPTPNRGLQWMSHYHPSECNDHYWPFMYCYNPLGNGLPFSTYSFLRLNCSYVESQSICLELPSVPQNQDTEMIISKDKKVTEISNNLLYTMTSPLQFSRSLTFISYEERESAALHPVDFNCPKTVKTQCLLTL